MNKNAVFVHFELIFLLSVNASPYFVHVTPSGVNENYVVHAG